MSPSDNGTSSILLFYQLSTEIKLQRLPQSTIIMKYGILGLVAVLLVTFVVAFDEEYMNGNMTMYLARAGPSKWALKSEVMLKPGARITLCPTDYRRGFSIRCEPTIPFTRPLQKVNFYVNNKLLETQYAAPYYLNGNNAVRVRSYYFGKRMYLKIQCVSKFVRPAVVIIRKNCLSFQKA